MYGDQMERLRRGDAELRARALALHTSTVRIVRNFLPAAVLRAVSERAVDGTNADIVAWSFDPACLLQSDIVAFTALGSRISPEDLCGFLHDLFSRFDAIAQRLGVHKIETVVSFFVRRFSRGTSIV